QARALQRALKQHNVELVIVSAHLSESITRVVLQRELSRCDAFLAFGTKDYGEDTGNPASTYKELEWWAVAGKPVGRAAAAALVMCACCGKGSGPRRPAAMPRQLHGPVNAGSGVGWSEPVFYSFAVLFV
ncbi:unnamed protein product, partial [Effrenium voratum]